MASTCGEPRAKDLGLDRRRIFCFIGSFTLEGRRDVGSRGRPPGRRTIEEGSMQMTRLMQVLWGLAGLALAGGPVLAQDGDAAAGEKVFNKCKACHVLNEEKNRVGPYLFGIMGRPAGTAEGFTYSPAMKESGIVWDEATIAEYVADPKEYVPGNRMAFPGLKKEEDITNLLAYLKEATQGG
jgi:cytochrome c